MIDRGTNIRAALRRRQRGFIINPYSVVPAASGPRYWRLNVTSGRSDLMILAQWELRIALGGADQTTGLGANMSASAFASGNPPSNLVDDTPNIDGWVISGGGYPHWCKIDFGAGNGKTIVQYTLTSGPSNGSLYAPHGFTLQSSEDNSSWTSYTAYTGLAGTWSGNSQTRTWTA